MILKSVNTITRLDTFLELVTDRIYLRDFRIDQIFHNQGSTDSKKITLTPNMK